LYGSQLTVTLTMNSLLLFSFCLVNGPYFFFLFTLHCNIQRTSPHLKNDIHRFMMIFKCKNIWTVCLSHIIISKSSSPCKRNMHIYTSHLWRGELRDEEKKKWELDTCSSAVTFYGIVNSNVKRKWNFDSLQFFWLEKKWKKERKNTCRRKTNVQVTYHQRKMMNETNQWSLFAFLLICTFTMVIW
jgi:hypothetical protein